MQVGGQKHTSFGFLLLTQKLIILIGSITDQLFLNCFPFSIFKTEKINLTNVISWS